MRGNWHLDGNTFNSSQKDLTIQHVLLVHTLCYTLTAQTEVGSATASSPTMHKAIRHGTPKKVPKIFHIKTLHFFEAESRKVYQACLPSRNKSLRLFRSRAHIGALGCCSPLPEPATWCRGFWLLGHVKFVGLLVRRCCARGRVLSRGRHAS